MTVDRAYDLCWQSKSEWAAEAFGSGSVQEAEAIMAPATCLLPAGHPWPHVWTPDTEIIIERATDSAR